MSAISKWFPSPSKFWIAVIVILCLGVIYGYAQEYSDVQTVQYQIAEINRNIDKMSDGLANLQATTNETRDVANSIHGHILRQRAETHHHYHLNGPHNPIADLFHNIFKGR